MGVLWKRITSVLVLCFCGFVVFSLCKQVREAVEFFGVLPLLLWGGDGDNS